MSDHKTTHFDMPVEINDDNLVTFTTPDGNSSSAQYPADWTHEQIMADFKVKLSAIPAVKNLGTWRDGK